MPASKLEIMGPLTTAERDALVTNGNMGPNTLVLNSDTGGLEYWTGSVWVGVLGENVTITGTLLVGTTLSAASADISGTLTTGVGDIVMETYATRYGGVDLQGRGFAAIHDIVSLTGKGSATAPTNFTNGGSAGLYRVGYYLVVTTADAGAAGTLRFDATFNDGTAARTLTGQTIAVTATNHASTFTNTESDGSLIWLGSGSIAYSVTLTGSLGTARYSIYAALERLW